MAERRRGSEIKAEQLVLSSWLMVTLLGCAPTSVLYHGAEHPQVAASGDDVKVFGGRAEAPHRHEVIGTVVATSHTASEDDIVTRLVRPRAAMAGGTAIHHVDCETRRPDEDDDISFAGVVTICGANVLRALDAGRPVELEQHGEEVMELEHTRVALATPYNAPQLSEVDHVGVGVLEIHPVDHAYFGTTAATCVGSCPRSTLSRAIRIAAAKRGAVAVAGLQCKLDGAVSRCTATLVGPELDSLVSPDAPRPRLAAELPARPK